MNPRTFNVAVKIENERLCISSLIGDPTRRGLPTTSLTFSPLRAESTISIVMHWKSEVLQDAQQRAKIESAVVDYCRQLLDESAYEGPIDCCL